MRRSLVLTDEAARHPFRASLPEYCRIPEHLRGPEIRAHAANDLLAGDDAEADGCPYPQCGDEAAQRPVSSWRLSRDDVRQFLGHYCAYTLAVVTYIV